MIDIVVIRGTGDSEGEDIVEPLLSTLHAALERGTNEMDRWATAKAVRVVSVPFTQGVETGQLHEVDDELQNAVYRGKVTSVNYQFTSGQEPIAQMQITLEVPTEFYS